MTDNSHHYKLRVYYEDTDAGGIVYYVNYLKFTERARTEWLRELGIDQSYFLKQQQAFVVRKVQMNHLASAKLDDELTVVSSFITIKKASVVFHQEIYNQHQEKLFTAEVVVAFVHLANNKNKPCAITPEILGVLPRVS